MADTSKTRGHLQAQGLSYRAGHRPLLQDIALEARPGTLTAVIGPNGAGKSTLLKALVGIHRAQGELLLDGRSLRSLPLEARARAIAWVPQESLLRTALSVREAVAFGRFPHLGASGVLRAQDRTAVDDAMARTAVAHLADRIWTTLSGGERRRVLIARALCTQPQVLLLDEPTASLDIQHTLRTLALMRSLADQGLTVICALHDLSHVLEIADQALLLHQGRSVAFGPAQDVIREEQIRDVYGVSMRHQSALTFALAEES